MSEQKQIAVRKTEFDTVIRLVNITISSARVKTITYGRPSGDTRTISGNIHLGLFGRYSSLKSTILEAVKEEKKEKAVIVHSLTVASLVGSIDARRNIPIMPLAWEVRNKVLMIDEFQSNRKEKKYVIEALNSLLSTGKFEKEFIATTKSEIDLEENGLYCKITNGKISIKTNFSLIIASMKPIEDFLKWENQRAFFSRLIPVTYEIDRVTQKAIVEGFKKIEIQEYPVQEKITLSTEAFLEIERFLEHYGFENLQGYNRLLETLIRIRAVLGYFDEDLSLQVAEMYRSAEEIAEKIDRAREAHLAFWSSRVRA
jgi:virulence-associated protein VapD